MGTFWRARGGKTHAGVSAKKNNVQQRTAANRIERSQIESLLTGDEPTRHRAVPRMSTDQQDVSMNLQREAIAHYAAGHVLVVVAASQKRGLERFASLF